jgi:hypothetical protein
MRAPALSDLDRSNIDGGPLGAARTVKIAQPPRVRSMPLRVGCVLRLLVGCLLAVAPCAHAALPLEVYGRLPRLEHTALSPDGARVAFVGTDGDERVLALMVLATGQVVAGQFRKLRGMGRPAKRPSVKAHLGLTQSPRSCQLLPALNVYSLHDKPQHQGCFRKEAKDREVRGQKACEGGQKDQPTHTG